MHHVYPLIGDGAILLLLYRWAGFKNASSPRFWEGKRGITIDIKGRQFCNEDVFFERAMEQMEYRLEIMREDACFFSAAVEGLAQKKIAPAPRLLQEIVKRSKQARAHLEDIFVIKAYVEVKLCGTKKRKRTAHV